MTTPRIAPIEPPYGEPIQKAFDKIMPPGVDPLLIFRTMAHHLDLLRRITGMGATLLQQGQLGHRQREIVLLRTCANWGAEYEWGVHVTAFARPLGFSEEEIAATVHGGADAACWSDDEALLIRAADELKETGTLSNALWAALRERWSDSECIEIMSIAGLYAAISYIVNACRIELEPAGERFPAA